MRGDDHALAAHQPVLRHRAHPEPRTMQRLRVAEQDLIVRLRVQPSGEQRLRQHVCQKAIDLRAPRRRHPPDQQSRGHGRHRVCARAICKQGSDSRSSKRLSSIRTCSTRSDGRFCPKRRGARLRLHTLEISLVQRRGHGWHRRHVRIRNVHARLMSRRRGDAQRRDGLVLPAGRDSARAGNRLQPK